jgi:hypothetical protein
MGDLNTFFPILLLCVSFLTLTNALNRILVFLKAEDLQFGQGKSAATATTAILLLY